MNTWGPAELTFVDLFSGCGGASLGLIAAGFRPLAAVEIDRTAAAAYELNTGLRPISRSIRGVSGNDLLRAAGVRPEECTLLSGCPPCQSFTSLRKGANSTRRDRRRNSLAQEYLRVAADIRPRHIAFENVPGMLSKRWRPRFDALLDGLQTLGYQTAWSVLDAAAFGVPQHRRRILVVASRVVAPILPRPTHGEDSSGLLPYVTVRHAIANLPALASGEIDAEDLYHRARRHSSLALRRLRAIPEGGARRDLPPGLELECHKNHNGHYDIYGRMWWDRPAPTLTSGCTNVTRGRFAHPTQDRAITLREALLLQTFPPGAVLRGGVEDMALQVGNAIPPLLAQRIGEAIATMEMRSRKPRQRGWTVPPTAMAGVPARSSATSTLTRSAT